MQITQRAVVIGGIIAVVVAAALLTIPTTLYAEEFGEWKIGRAEAGVLSFTTNDSGTMLGQFCWYDTELCQWLLGTTIPCNKEEIYPVLANASTGSYHFEMKCFGILPSMNEIYAYAFIKPEKIDDVIRSSTKIGFAFPLKNDNFKVSRFKLNGANKSCDFMLQVFKQKLIAKPRDGGAARDYEF